MKKLKCLLTILALMTTCTAVFAAEERPPENDPESQPLQNKISLESILNSSKSLQNLQTKEIIQQLKDKTPQDPGVEEMVVELERRAEKEDAVAMNAMASAYIQGKFVEKNPYKAENFFLGAARVGDNAESAVACLNLYGLKRQDPNKPTEESMAWLLKGASRGNAKAQFNLGNCYHFGIGVTKDLVEAARWYTEAADQGDVWAQDNLGFFYKKGIGVTKDLEKAAQWFAKAAVQGDARAQNNLGVCYEFGSGVTKDLVKAAQWYATAADQGNAKAQNNLGDCYRKGSGVTKSKEKALESYTKAAAQGHERARQAIENMKESE